MSAPSGGEILLPLILARREAARAARDSAAAARRESVDRARLASEASPSDARALADWRRIDAAVRSEEITERIEELRTLLEFASRTEPPDFESLKAEAQPPPFDPGGLDEPEPPPVEEHPSPPVGIVARIFPSTRARYLSAVEEARSRHQQAVADHAERERDRERRLQQRREEHERAVRDAEARAAAGHRAIDTFRAALEAGDPDAVLGFLALVLSSSDYPEGFPRRATLAMDPESRLLVVDYELPGPEIVPAAESFAYDPASGRIEVVPRPASRRKDLYALVAAEVALRSVKELFDADRTRTLGEIAFNGYVHGTDRVTGEAVRPCLVSFRVGRDEFRLLDVTKTDPIVSIRSIDAAYSTNPAELAPVRPVAGVQAVGVRHMISTPD